MAEIQRVTTVVATRFCSYKSFPRYLVSTNLSAQALYFLRCQGPRYRSKNTWGESMFAYGCSYRTSGYDIHRPCPNLGLLESAAMTSGTITQPLVTRIQDLDYPKVCPKRNPEAHPRFLKTANLHRRCPRSLDSLMDMRFGHVSKSGILKPRPLSLYHLIIFFTARIVVHWGTPNSQTNLGV